MVEHEKLPEIYVRAEADRQRLDEVVLDLNLPVIEEHDNPDRAAVVSQMAAACRDYGFFQVRSHEQPEQMQAAMAIAYDLLGLSPEEKTNFYSDDPAKKMRLSSSFKVRKDNWRDFFRLHCHPLEQSALDWPAIPPRFRYQPDQGAMAGRIEETGWSQGSENFGGCPVGPLRPEPARQAANVETSTELPDVTPDVDDTSPELPPEVAADVDVRLLDLEVGTIFQIMQSVIPRASAPTRGQLATTLFVVSSFTALFGLTALFHLPAAGPVFGRYKDSYYLILAIVLAAAAVELATAYWLARSNGRCILALAKVGLPVAYLILLVVFSIGGFLIPFSKVHPTR